MNAKVYYNEHDPEMLTIYLVTNLVNGRRYVGMTRRSIQERWREHLQVARAGRNWALPAAIRRYGATAFKIEAVATAGSWKEACRLESLEITRLETRAPNGYNLTAGGDGVCGLDADTIRRTALRNRGRHHTTAARAKIGAASLGRAVSAETRARIGAKHSGKKLTEEHRQKLAIAKMGKKLPTRSQTHRQRISEGLRRAHASRAEWRINEQA